MKMRQADNGQLSRLSRWGALSHSHLLSECAREEVIIEPCDSQAMACKQLSAGIVSADASPLSMDQQHFNTIMKEEKQKTHPHISPEKHHSCGFRWEACLMSGSFQDLQRSWPTIVVPKGTLLSGQNSPIGDFFGKHSLLCYCLEGFSHQCSEEVAGISPSEQALLGIGSDTIF